MFVLPDFRRPFSRNEVGPSAMTLFHGGEIGRGDASLSGSLSFRLLLGGSSGLLSGSGGGSEEGVGARSSEVLRRRFGEVGMSLDISRLVSTCVVVS